MLTNWSSLSSPKTLILLDITRTCTGMSHKPSYAAYVFLIDFLIKVNSTERVEWELARLTAILSHPDYNSCSSSHWEHTRNIYNVQYCLMPPHVYKGTEWIYDGYASRRLFFIIWVMKRVLVGRRQFFFTFLSFMFCRS